MTYTPTSDAECQACFTCDGWIDAMTPWSESWPTLVTPDGVAGITLRYLSPEDGSWSVYPGWYVEVLGEPIIDIGWDGSVSDVCACVYSDDPDLWWLMGMAFNPETIGGADCDHDAGSQYIFDDIDSISGETGFLTSPWNLEAIDDMSLADNLGTGKSWCILRAR